MTTIFIDSTETVQNFGLKSENFKKLIDLRNDGNITVVIPEVVVRETLRKWKNNYTEKLNKLISSQREMQILRSKLYFNFQKFSLVDEMNEEEGDLTNLRENTPPLLDQRKFEQYLNILHITIAPLPRINIDSILSRELERKKPFTTNEKGFGKGFRDTLIWETIKEYIGDNKNNGPFYLVSNNSTDFANAKRTEIDPSLLEELQFQGLCEVAWVSNLENLLSILEPIKTNATSDSEDSYDMENKPSKREENDDDFYFPYIEGANKKILQQEINLPDRENYGGLNIGNLYFPPEIESAFIDNIEIYPDSLEIHTHKKSEGNEILADANIDASITFSAFVYKPDQYIISNQERREYDLSVSDIDYNQRYVEFYGKFEARIHYQIHANPSQKIVNFIELYDVIKIKRQ